MNNHNFNSMKNQEETPPNTPSIPTIPEKNPDPTKPSPGGNEPQKVDPTRIEEPRKLDPTRIEEPKKNEPIRREEPNPRRI